MEVQILHVVIGLAIGFLNVRSWSSFAEFFCGGSEVCQSKAKRNFFVLKSGVVLSLVLYFLFFGTADILYFAGGFFLALLPMLFRKTNQ